MIRFALKALAYLRPFRLALDVVRLGGALLLLLAASSAAIWDAGYSLPWALLAHEPRVAAFRVAFILVVVLLFTLLVCGPIRRFLAAQRRWRRWPRVAAWAVAGLSTAAVVLLVVGISGVVIRNAYEVRRCERNIFPAIALCQKWYTACLTTGRCRFPRYWPTSWAYHFSEPRSLFRQFERDMIERHTKLGYIDIDNPEHYHAVGQDWVAAHARVLERGLLFPVEDLDHGKAKPAPSQVTAP